VPNPKGCPISSPRSCRPRYPTTNPAGSSGCAYALPGRRRAVPARTARPDPAAAGHRGPLAARGRGGLPRRARRRTRVGGLAEPSAPSAGGRGVHGPAVHARIRRSQHRPAGNRSGGVRAAAPSPDLPQRGPITSIHVWRNGDRIEREWYDGPNHAEIADVLLDPLVGLPGTIDRSCRCTVDDDCWSVRLRWAHAVGARLNLRRGTWGWTPDRETASAHDRVRRGEAMRRCRVPVRAAGAP
jgi:hypothetical protein